MTIEMIDIYNQHELNSEFPEIKPPSEEEIDTMIQTHGNKLLREHLNHFAFEDLKAIVMFYQLDIKDDKQTQINIIRKVRRGNRDFMK